jgi:hypothetical protein
VHEAPHPESSLKQIFMPSVVCSQIQLPPFAQAIPTEQPIAEGLLQRGAKSTGAGATVAVAIEVVVVVVVLLRTLAIVVVVVA